MYRPIVMAFGLVWASQLLPTGPPAKPLPPDADIEVVDGTGASDPFAGWRISVPGNRQGQDPPSSSRPSGGAEGDSANSVTADGPAAVCVWAVINEPASSAAWGGRTAAQGRIEALNCGATSNDGTGMGSARLDVRFVPNSAPGVILPPPPDPAVLAEQAYKELRVPSPSIGVGPDRSKVAVNLWTWLWVDNPGPLTATVAAAGVSVSATATLGSVTWSLGEPTTTGDEYAGGPPASITCQNAGVAPTPADDWKSEPPCGYKFRWRSTKERTGGTGTWPVTATSNWDVTWQSNTGVTGTTTLAATSADAFDVGEFRTVLVQQPGG